MYKNTGCCLSWTASGIPQEGASNFVGSVGGISASPGAPNCPGNKVKPGIKDKVAALPLGKGC